MAHGDRPKRFQEISVTVAQARALQSDNGVTLKGATVHMTLGPNWKDIVWITGANGKHPYYSPSHTLVDIKKLIAPNA